MPINPSHIAGLVKGLQMLDPRDDEALDTEVPPDDLDETGPVLDYDAIEAESIPLMPGFTPSQPEVILDPQPVPDTAGQIIEDSRITPEVEEILRGIEARQEQRRQRGVR